MPVPLFNGMVLPLDPLPLKVRNPRLDLEPDCRRSRTLSGEDFEIASNQSGHRRKYV